MAQERNDVETFDSAEESDLSTDLEASGALEAQDDTSDDDPTEHIKEQIDETRNQMGETIDAIQEKLSFSNLSEQVSDHVNNAVETAKDAVYQATIGKAASIMTNIGSEISSSKIIKTAKNNPLPFVLIGAGIGLLAYNNYASGSKKGQSAGLARRQSGQTGANGSVVGTAKDKLSGAAGTVSAATGTAFEKVSGAAETVYSGAGDVASKAYSKIGDLGSSVRGQYDTQINDHPLAVGAVALALGAAVGMALPATRYEGELFGNARQDLIDKAQDTASNLIEKAKEKATEVGHSLGERVNGSAEEGIDSAESRSAIG